MRYWTACRTMSSVLLFGFAVGLLWCVPVEAVVVDDFSDGPIVITASNAAATMQMQSGLDAAAVVGGKRRWTVQSYSIVGPSPLATATVDTLLGELRLQAAASNNGSLRLRYGTNDDQLAVDLTAGGHDRLRIDFSELPSDPAKILGFLVSADTVGPGISGSSRSFLDEVRGLGTSGTLDVPYSLLPFPTFSDIDILELTISVAANTTVAIADIRSVPEPASAILVLVIVAIGVSQRRARL